MTCSARCGERMLDLQYCKVVFVGGGAILFETADRNFGQGGNTILRTENQCKCGWL